MRCVEALRAEPFRARMDALPEHRVMLDGDARRAKEAGCLAYASQLGFQFGGPEGLRAKLADSGATETFRGSLHGRRQGLRLSSGTG